MSRRYWIALAAIGLALALPPNAACQENGDDTERGEGDSPIQELRLPNPLPVKIVVEDREEDARQAAERRAEQRAQYDLEAQQGMNRATQRMAFYSVLQTILVGIGTALLFYTLWLTRQANRAAVSAAVAANLTVEATREIGQRQLRPYVAIQPINIRFIAPPEGLDPSQFLTIEIYIEAANMGHTPAYNLRVSGGLRVVNFAEEDINNLPLPSRGDPGPPSMLIPNNPNRSNNLRKPVRIEPCIQQNRGGVLIYAMATYEADGICYFSKFCGLTTNFADAAAKASALVQEGAKQAPLPKVGFSALHYGNEAI